MTYCSCGNPNCKLPSKRYSTTGTQTINDLMPSTLVVSRSPSLSPSNRSSRSRSRSQSESRSRSRSRSRSPSPNRKRKKRYSKRACKHIMFNSSKKLCYPPLRKKYAKLILKSKSKKRKKKAKK